MAVDLPDYWSQVEALLSMDFVDLQDTPTNYIGDDTKACVVDEANDQLIFDWPIPALHGSDHENGEIDEISVDGLSGELADDQPSNFLKLSDTPATYAGHAGEVLAVNAGENALEYSGGLGPWLYFTKENPAGVAAITIAGLDSTKMYMAIIKVVGSLDTGELFMRFNADAGNNYDHEGHWHDDALSHGVVAATGVSIIRLMATVPSKAGYPVMGDILFGIYPGINNIMHVKSHLYQVDFGLDSGVADSGGIYVGGAEVTSVTFGITNGTMTGQIILFEQAF